MSTTEQDIEASCDFLSRFLTGERGFIREDVLAGIGRLRELHGRSSSAAHRDRAARCVQRACEKLGLKDHNYAWACAV